MLLGSLHSFIYEIGRFSKTSGFHYSVDGGKIKHHGGKWEATYNHLFNYILILGNDGQVMEVYPNGVVVNGHAAEAVETPEGHVFTAPQIWSRVVEAIAKYAVASFFGVEYADSIHPILQSTG